MAGIYHNATLGVISLSSDGESWITIADKNLGATTVYNDGDTLSEANAGKYYQWGNNYGFPFTGPTTTSSTQVNANTYGPGNYYSSSTFITNSSSPYIWDSSNNNNLRGGVTGTVEAMQGPCISGYHIASNSDFNFVVGILSSLGISSNIKQYLKMPFTGWIEYNGNISNRGDVLYYAASTYYGTSNIYVLYSNGIKTEVQSNNGLRVRGYSIRPFKNEAVIPYANEGWSKLYGDDLPDRPIPPLPKLKWLVKGNNYYYFDEAPVHVSGISLDKDSIILTTVGQTEQLTATVTPEDAIDKRVLWSSSDTSVATVSNTGLVTCVTPGECIITVTCVDGGASASCSVAALKHIDFLLIGGGGGGSGFVGGGGGAGGVIQCSDYVLNEGSYSITIGSGGTGRRDTTYYAGNDGGNSVALGFTAYGGGGGGGLCYSQPADAKGYNGGSGGGGGYMYGNRYGHAAVGGTGCSGQGYSGGNGYCYAGGGGGGAGGAGSIGSNACGGKGGIGIQSNISGTSTWYAGGGSGFEGQSMRNPTAANCGGTQSGVNALTNATICGAGGGATCSGCNSGNVGKGGNGIFILRYPSSKGYNITGGTKYTCGDYTIHCFISSGTLTVSE